MGSHRVGHDLETKQVHHRNTVYRASVIENQTVKNNMKVLCLVAAFLEWAVAVATTARARGQNLPLCERWGDGCASPAVGPCATGCLGFSGGSDSKASACSVGDLGSIPGLGRSPGEGNGNPLQYSCLENSMDWGAPQSLVGYSPWCRKESDTTERLHFHFSLCLVNLITQQFSTILTFSISQLKHFRHVCVNKSNQFINGKMLKCTKTVELKS